MADPTETEIESALARGRGKAATEPRALSARYDRDRERVVIELADGCAFAFPPKLVEGLSAARAEELEQIELLGDGYGLHWEALDTDYTVPGLMAGVFGTASYIARRAGKATSAAKAAAARANGAKGGRPRKSASR